MANRLYRHPIASRDDPTENVPNVLQDELDGSFSEVTRARLEGWDEAIEAAFRDVESVLRDASLRA